jgi:hypothetical protein
VDQEFEEASSDTLLMIAIQIDLNTLLVVMIANITALACFTCRDGVANQRGGTFSPTEPAISWIPMILSNLWPETLADRFLISVGGFAASNWMQGNESLVGATTL